MGNGATLASHRSEVGTFGGQSWTGFVLGLSGLSGLFPRSLASSRMAKSKASKQKSRSKDLKVLESHRCFEGTVFRCRHHSEILGVDARFSVYVPDAPRIQTTLPYPHDCEEFPVLLFLSDEGCTDLEILTQGNLLQHCSDCGLILVSADTCPRPEAETAVSANFYVNATEKPYDSYKMQDYLEAELLELVHHNFPSCGSDAVSIMGHGMGGTGALTMALRNDAIPFRSVSALAPVLNPMSTEVTKKLAQALKHLKALNILKLSFRRLSPSPVFSETDGGMVGPSRVSNTSLQCRGPSIVFDEAFFG